VSPLAPIDRATLGYAAVAFGFGFARGPRSGPARVLLPLGLLLVGLVASALAPRARRAGPAGRFLGEFYPLLLAVALYTHVGLVNAAGGIAHDAAVMRWEAALFGGQPSLAWIRAFPSPAWSTLMHGAYLSYYFILAGPPLGLWLCRRREAARGTVLLVMSTLYACYTVSFLFPVAGPRYLFPPAANAATAVPVAAFVHRLLRNASAWGTAFPSSHVAAALVAAGCACRSSRPLGAALLPAAVLLSLATVYGQFHYAVDAVGGAALALAALIADRRAGYDSPPSVKTDRATTQGASP